MLWTMPVITSQDCGVRRDELPYDHPRPRAHPQDHPPTDGRDDRPDHRRGYRARTAPQRALRNRAECAYEHPRHPGRDRAQRPRARLQRRQTAGVRQVGPRAPRRLGTGTGGGGLMATFKRATKQQAKLRMALIGPSGSGKTYTALKIATQLGDRVAVIDTERGSASKYADKFEFDVLELDSFHPQRYIEGIQAAEAEGYDVLIIDSLSHAWAGKDGALELVDKAAKRMQSSNTFAAWRDVTPLHNALVDAMLQSRLHLIVTMRAKTEYIVEKDERTGKSVPRKVGLAPIQRDGLEYEFDVVADMDLDNTLIVSKSRCEALSGAVIPKPGEEVAGILKAWLTDGAPVQDAPQPQPARAANGASKGGDESKREDYHAALAGYLTQAHGIDAAQYVSLIDYAIGGTPQT